MTQNDTLTNLNGDPTDTIDLAGVDRAALARLDLNAISVNDLATWLRDHGPAHLSDIERIELAERLITRRRFLVGAGALGAAALGACGASEEAVAPTPPPGVSVGYPRTITDLRGSVTIPARPERVLCASAFMDLGTLLAFNVVPVAIRSYDFGLLPYYAERVDDRPEPLNLGYEPYNLEQIITLRPDLILMYEVFATEEDLDTLSQLDVPIVVLPNYGYRNQLEIVGALLGEETKAVELADALEQQIADFRMTQTPISIAALSPESDPGTIYLYGPNTSPARFMDDIGLTFRTPLPADAIYGETFSMERLSDIDADFVLVTQFFGEDAATIIAEEPLYQAIPAIAAGRFAVLSSFETWPIETADALSIPAALDILRRVLST